jgi:hypothetical protein
VYINRYSAGNFQKNGKFAGLRPDLEYKKDMRGKNENITKKL